MSCSIMIAVNDTRSNDSDRKTDYLIQRKGIRVKNASGIKIETSLFRVSNKDREKLIELGCLDDRETNKKIIGLVGNFEDCVTTCFCLQNNKLLDFGDMTHSQKKLFLHEILQLDVYKKYEIYTKDKIKCLLGQIKSIDQRLAAVKIGALVQEMDCLEISMKTLLEKKSLIDSNIELYDNCIAGTLVYEKMQTSIEGIDNALDNVDAIMEAKKNIEDDIASYTNNRDIDSMRKEKTILINKLEKIDEKYDNWIDDLISQKKDTRSLNNLKCDLLSKIRLVLTEISADTLINERSKIVTNISSIDKQHRSLASINIEDIQEQIKINSNEIDILKGKLMPVSNVSLQYVLDLAREVATMNSQINSAILEYMDKRHVDSDTHIKITTMHDENTKFYGHVKETLRLMNEHRDIIPIELIFHEEKWINKYNDWVDTLGSYEIGSTRILTEMMTHEKNLYSKLTISYANYWIAMENSKINAKIDMLENESDKLRDVIVRHNNERIALEMLAIQKDTLIEKLSNIDLCLIHAKENQDISVQNDKIHADIDVIDSLIFSNREVKKKYNNKRDNLVAKIRELSASIKKQKYIQDNFMSLKQKQRSLENYHLKWIIVQKKNASYLKWMKIKKEMDEDRSRVGSDISQITAEIETIKRAIDDYMQEKKVYDEKVKKMNLYQKYLKIVSINGLPHSILKEHVPVVEREINTVLQKFTDFTVKIDFDKNTLKIDMMIQKCDEEPYNMGLASGFEKFIIGLAVRIAIGKITAVCRPDMIVIDEGWGCFDQKNRDNLENIFSYIKKKYCHVLLISPMDDIKKYMDYTITVGKKQGYSYIKKTKDIV